MTPQNVYVLSGITIIICVILSLFAGRKKKVKVAKLPVTETIFPVSAGITAPVFYDVIEGVYKNKPVKLSGVKWHSDNYENKVGEYVFKAIAPSGYKFTGISIKVKVVEEECFKENDGNYEISNAVIFSNEATTLNLFDLTGCNLIKTMPGISKNVEENGDKYVALHNNATYLGGYVYKLKVASDTVISSGTVGWLIVENGATLKLTDNADIQTLIVEEAKKIDIALHNGNLGDVVQKQKTIVQYVARNANQLSRYSLPESSIVIGENAYKGIIVDILSDVNSVSVQPNTPVDEIPLPKTLKVLLASGETEISVKWTCDNYNGEENVFKFVPLFDDLAMSDSVDKTEITVICASDSSIETEFPDIPEKTVLTERIEDANLSVNALCRLGENTFTIKLTNVRFVFDEANSVYVLDKSSVDKVFDIDDTCIYAEFVDQTVFKENKLEIDSLKIRIDADKNGVMNVTDIAGIQTFADNINEIESIKISGDECELVIDTPYAKISDDILIDGIDSPALINIHARYVGKLRYSADIADNVVICGVSASDYLNRTPLQFKNTFFANGIPVIIRQDDGETYVYRANDLTKISSVMTGGNVFGGSYKEDIDSTNVTFESGILHDYYGGSEKGNVYGEIYSSVSGGFVNNDYFGGSSDSDYCEKVISVLEKGAVKHYWFGGGANSGVGVPGKEYDDNEYAIELYMFDGIFTNFNMGLKSDCGRNVYGNIRLEMFDGIGLNYKCGSTTDRIFGNVDVAVYGGTVEKQFVQSKTVEGYTKIKAYRSLRVDGVPENKFPFVTVNKPDKFFYSFFDTDYRLKWMEYTRDISAVYSKEGDEGNLVVRFPEIMKTSETKGDRRIRKYTGDGMILTFPNGQVMLIDTPYDLAWENYKRDIEALSIGHIDYFMLTHYHPDHFECLPKLLETHTVGTFILPDVKFSSPYVEGAIPENANVVRINMSDTMEIGEGDKAVKITFLNPPFFAKKAMVPNNHNPFSLCTVLEFGTSKLLLGADTYDANEYAWLYECPDLISDVDVIKPGHHGITSSSRYDYFRKVNPKYVCITNLREYGCHMNSTIYMLENVNKMSSERIFSTGKHGMIKATLNGKKGEATIVTEYVEK